MNRTALFVFAVWVSFSARADDVWRREAAELLDVGVSRGLTLSADGTTLELSRGRLYEDDGPAAGFSYLPNEEKLVDGLAIRKQLVVDDPRAFETFLLVGSGGKLEAVINGKPQPLEAPKKVGNYWDEYRLPPDTWRKGVNDIVVSGKGSVYIARDDERPPGESPPPNRSAKSVDGGKTWNDARLGKNDDLDGEYYVRLFLDRHLPTGELTLPVVDLANLEEKPIAPLPKTLGPLRVRVTADVADETQVAVFARTGTTLAPDDKQWTEWRRFSGLDAEVTEPKGRFAQVRIELSTAHPLRTPKLRRVELQAATQPAADWTAGVKAIELPKSRIVRSSIPFEFESPDHPRLQQLRKEQKLDEVVAGAKTEWEKITKLAAWSSTRWTKGVGHLKNAYPKWDALEILAPHADGTPVGGFCQHYNIVFLQACESLGIRGRPVSIGAGDYKDRIRSGHEVVELWSNDYQKWVHVDGDAAWYFVDSKTREPLGLRELHDRQIAAFNDKPYDGVDLVTVAPGRYKWDGLTSFPPFAELRMIPRSNMFAKSDPVPLNQGMRGWPWTGHAVWTEPHAPPAHLYGNRITTKSNWNWNLNETDVRLAATDTADEVQMLLDTNTPGFTGFEATIDGGEPRRVENGFAWKLHRGSNRLVVRARNETGPCPPATVVLERSE